MADVGLPAQGYSADPTGLRKSSRLTRLLASPRFQAWAARNPLTRRFVRREGAAMFDLVAGFCHSQILFAFVKLGLPQMLLEREMTAPALAQEAHVPPERMQVLLSGAVALDLLKKRRSGHYALTVRGAALTGVPGLMGMIAHHDILYRDLSDPVAFFRGEVETELADFWPYVFGAGAAEDPGKADIYSSLMADSQSLVAADTLEAVHLRGAAHLMDVGGGTGAFLSAVAARYRDIRLTLFDLPAVLPAAGARFADAGFTDRVRVRSGSFREGPLPEGADMISLIRVLYDHSDATVAALLRAVYEALPPNGRILISEPMADGIRPERAGDAYFALYCMAMRTGRARSADQIATLLSKAGFTKVTTPKVARPYITSVVQAVRPG